MSLARARTADEDRVAFGVEEGAGGEFANLAFVYRRVREDELVDVLEDRELRAGDAIADRACLSVGALGAVEAACAEALEAGIASGDVILTVLARRRQPAPPPSITTPDALRLKIEPAADCGRYDRIRKIA